jgi:hypothetical protein
MSTWDQDFMKWYNDLAGRLGEHNPLLHDILAAYDKIAENVAPLDLMLPHVDVPTVDSFILPWGGLTYNSYDSSFYIYGDRGRRLSITPVSLDEPLPDPIVKALEHFTYKENE